MKAEISRLIFELSHEVNKDPLVSQKIKDIANCL
jgi:hypothetical protein